MGYYGHSLVDAAQGLVATQGPHERGRNVNLRLLTHQEARCRSQPLQVRVTGHRRPYVLAVFRVLVGPHLVAL